MISYFDSEGGIPHIWVRDWINLWHFSLVVKVSVLDMLSQPVLGEVSYFLGDGEEGSLDGVHDSKMTKSVVRNVVSIVRDDGEHGLLISGEKIMRKES